MIENLEYNSDREDLIIPEYGRHIHKMVNQAIECNNKDERNNMAKAIIGVMGNLNPHLRDVPDFQHKLWDQLFIMSQFQLDVDSPYPKPSKEIFEQIKIKNNVHNILEVFKLSPKKWRGKLVNDLESHVFEKYSILKSIKDNLYSHGAIYASMSGSGSSIFGIFEKYTKVRNISPDFFTWGNFV